MPVSDGNIITNSFEMVKNTFIYVDEVLTGLRPWKLVIGTAVGVVTVLHIRRLYHASDQPIHTQLFGAVFGLICRLPTVRGEIEKQLNDTRRKIHNEIHKYDRTGTFFGKIPESGMDSEEIISIAEQYDAMIEVVTSKVSGAIYNDQNDEQRDLLSKIFNIYAYANPLHPDIFPGCRKMEAEIVHIVADLFHGGPECCGTVTTGGTESILLAMHTYRNHAKAKGITEPEILVPVTAHAAFDKAAHLFGMRIRHVRVGHDQRVQIDRMKRAISRNTCVLVGSAPNYPTGTIDDIEQIAQLGRKYNIPVHVDACLGGFLIAFMEDADYPIPPFDFRVKGVTSISCDTHKYGYTPKGSSVILYQGSEYLHYQYMCIPDWTGGIYATPTFAGSRCGLSISLTWATLLHFGRSGYVQRTRKIIECARRISFTIEKEIGELRLLGSPDVSVVAFTSDVLNIYAVVDGMSVLGWNLNSLQNPAGAHICVTYNTAIKNAWLEFKDDLKKVISNLINKPCKMKQSDMTAIYGLAATIPDKNIISDVAYSYLDACYSSPFSEPLQS